MPVIGVLSGGGNDFPAFIKGVAESGYENGRNVRIEFTAVVTINSGRWQRNSSPPGCGDRAHWD